MTNSPKPAQEFDRQAALIAQQDDKTSDYAFVAGARWQFNQDTEALTALQKENEFLRANKMSESVHLEAKLAIAVEALERITGMVETWSDQYGQSRTEEIYASTIARETLSKIKESGV